MLKHGILGLINYGDMTGYEIREAFKSSLNYFWSAQTSQIYRELDNLEEKGWIQKQVVEQSGKPNRNLCSITEDGRKELLRWLTEDKVDAGLRSTVLMRVFFMGELPASESVGFFKSLVEDSSAALLALEQTDTNASIQAYRNTVQTEKKTLFWRMTADFGKRYLQMCSDWAKDCIRLLESEEK